MSRLFLFLVLCGCVRAGVLSIKGLYCQDPETGRLYGVNTTWPSTTFCGNYTCKIRIRNQDMTHAQSRTIINITGPDFEMDKLNEAANHLSREIKNNTSIGDDKKDNVERKSILLNQYLKNNAVNANLNNINLNSIPLPLQNSFEDRFLNGEEIKTISDLLHTVKKSDLEAIIDIYNLAQDIYKEMDEATTDTEVKEALKHISEKDSQKLGKSSEVKDTNNDHTSYWYDPLGVYGFRKQAADLKSDGSEYRPTAIQRPQPQAAQVTYPTQATTNTQPVYAYQPTRPTYLSGLSSNKGFGRLEYYYPVSNFQKLASFYNQKSRYDLPPSPARIPCNPSCNKNHVPPTYRDLERPYNPLPKPATAESSLLLPFSYSVQPYNTSANPYSHYNNYYKGNPWPYYDYYKNSPYPHPFLPDGQVSPLASSEIISKRDEQNLAEIDEPSVITEKSKEDLKPWQTEPLSDAVIAEVRANRAERPKVLKIPYKKRIKLERVAKVIKLDHLNRHTREVSVNEEKLKAKSAENAEGLEAYIEKTTCDTSELGFFRVGNMSHPFPACCPQKIEGR